MHRARSREDRIALIGEIMRKAIVFIIGIFLVCEGLSARDKSEKMRRVSLGATAGWAYLLGLDDYARELIHSHRTLFYTLNAAYRARIPYARRRLSVGRL